LPLVMTNFQRLLNGEEVEPLAIRILHKSGEYSVQEFVTRSEKNNGDVVGIWGVARELVAPDGQIIASSSQPDDKRLADLIRSTVLSTRDPLSVLTTSTYLLQKMVQDPQQLNHTQVIMTQIQSLTSLIEGLLTLSRYDTDRIEMVMGPLDIHWLLRLVAQEFGMLAQLKNIKLQLELADEPLVVEADAAQIHKALNSTLSNYNFVRQLTISMVLNGSIIQSKFRQRTFMTLPAQEWIKSS
jgi:signal transduction histidine kinase